MAHCINCAQPADKHKAVQGVAGETIIVCPTSTFDEVNDDIVDPDAAAPDDPKVD